MEEFSEWMRNNPSLVDYNTLKLSSIRELQKLFEEIQALVNMLTTQCVVLSKHYADAKYQAAKQKRIPELEDLEFEIDSATGHVITRVYWDDGVVTVVKTTGKDQFDPLYGINLCYATRFAGSKNKLRNIYKKFAGVEYEHQFAD